MLAVGHRELCQGFANQGSSLHPLFGTPVDACATGRDPGDGRSSSAREPHRTGEGDLRASELDNGQGGLQGAGVPPYARGSRGASDCHLAGPAGAGDRGQPGRDTGLDVGFGSAAAHPCCLVRSPADPPGAGRGSGGTAIMERVCRPVSLSRPPQAVRGVSAILPDGSGRTASGVSPVRDRDP